MKLMKLVSIFLTVILAVGICPSVFASAEIPEGYTPIRNAEDLNNIRNNLDGNFILMNDIDLSEYENWVPVGTKEAPFTGALDGNGYAAKNLKINIVADSDVYAGLFGYIEKGSVKNISVINGIINVKTTAVAQIGLIGGEVLYSSIKDCFVNGNIFAEDAQKISVGGVLGNVVFSKVDKCSSDSNITIKNAKSKCYVGGIIGYGHVSNLSEEQQNRIYNSCSHGSIKLDSAPDNSFIGGISGVCWYLENVYSTVAFDLPSEISGYIGSLVGSATDPDYDYLAVMEPPVISNAFVLENSLKDAIGFENTFSTIKNVCELSKEELSKQESFIGFDFENIWKMDSENGYPVLRKYVEPENPPKEEPIIYLTQAEIIKVPFSKRIVFGTVPKSPEGIEIKLIYSNGDIITDKVRLSDDESYYVGTEAVHTTKSSLPLGKITDYGISEASYFFKYENVSFSYKYLALPSIIEIFKNLFN